MDKNEIESMISVMHEALHSGMWGMEFDEKGKMTSVSWSQEFRRMLGFEDTEDFPDRLESWSDRLHEDDRERVIKEFTDTINDYSDRKTYDVEYRLQTKSGEWRWFHALGRLLRRRDGTPVSYVGMFVDITERKNKDELLKESLERAESANRAKTVFLSNMSHDIRTPINGVMGMTTIALNHIDEKERVIDCLHNIEDSSRHLLSLVNDVLNLSRIEAGKISKNSEPFNVISLMSDCISIIGGQLAGREVDLNLSYDDIVHQDLIGDSLHLRQIFINILGNSVKFTKAGDSISMYAKEIGGDDKFVRFRFVLSDTGIGMSREFLPKLFNAFSQERTDGRTTYQGTGLGMAITKEFVELLGGSISVDSQLGEGTRFELDIPFEVDLNEKGDEKEKESDYDLNGMKVLVVEDVEQNLIIVTTLLEDKGVTVVSAENGKEAVEVFESSPEGQFDAILMDVMMPVMDGLEATRIIRAMDREDAKSVPIIAATANAYDEDIKKTREAGMDTQVLKPIDVDELYRTLAVFYKR